jgi:hypothetical protein
MLVHNAHDAAAAQLAGLGPHVRLLALSPHVVAALERRGLQADWWLAAWPPEGQDGQWRCPRLRDGSAAPGPWGFVAQGRLDGARRAYGALWEGLAAAANGSGGGLVPQLKLLGRSVGPAGASAVPRAARQAVTRVVNAQYNVRLAPAAHRRAPPRRTAARARGRLRRLL